MISSAMLRLIALGGALVIASGCLGDDYPGGARHLQPLSQATKAELRDKGMREQDPILVRIFKEEDELEIWKKRRDGRYAYFKTYEICAWSGELGPKHKEGDRQAPEGFYTVSPAQMNPNSSYYLSFNIGFPNTFDRAHGRSGSHLMVHGACSSAGCYAMTDEVMGEIYALAREAFRGGQRDFQVQAFPFRMTPENMARHADNPNMPFWRNLKDGSDHFEVTGVPPEVGVCDRRYVFNATPAEPGQSLVPTATCPRLDVPSEIESAVAARQMRDETKFQVALAEIRAREVEQAQIMLAAREALEEGSTEGYVMTASADMREIEAAVAPADEQMAAAETSPVAAPAFAPARQLGGAVTGMLNRIADFARLDTLRRGNDTPAASFDAPAEEGSAAGDEAAVAPAAASGFAPPRLHPHDPFAVFRLFDKSDGASVPADTIRR